MPRKARTKGARGRNEGGGGSKVELAVGVCRSTVVPVNSIRGVAAHLRAAVSCTWSLTLTLTLPGMVGGGGEAIRKSWAPRLMGTLHAGGSPESLLAYH